ncbi:hypothetical protein [Pseudalkalibacillus sp. SCS-8]|uniref:hypothetical protein n=1 Tax=Pseudalkalibacillus nanhaiensis TaxID=3115291 RepID=UPI0032DA9248
MKAKFMSLLVPMVMTLVPMGYEKMQTIEVESKLSTYTEEKYDFKVDLEEPNDLHYGNDQYIYHMVSPERKPELIFGIAIERDFRGDGFEIISDDYDLGQKAHKEYEKIKPFLSEMNDLGFKRHSDFSYVTYHKLDDGRIEYYLNLKEKGNYGVEKFKNGWEEKYFNLVEIIKATGADINYFRILMDYKEENDQMPIFFPNSPNINNAKELAVLIKKNHPESLASFELVYQLEEELDSLENERYSFEGAHHAEELGLLCGRVDEQGDCVDYRFFVKYEKGGLTADNPYLEDDLYRIMEGLDKIVGSDTKYYVTLIDHSRSREGFTSDQLNSREDVQRYIQETFE